MSTRIEPTVQVSLTKPRALKCWLEDNGITLDSIAEEWRVGKSQVSKRLRAMKCSAEQRDALEKKFGVPKNLLPEVTDGKPGPRVGWLQNRQNSATMDIDDIDPNYLGQAA